MRYATNLKWTGAPPKTKKEKNLGTDYPWFDEDGNGKLVPFEAFAHDQLSENGKGEMFKGGVIIEFNDKAQLCVALSHITYDPRQKKRKRKEPIRYLINPPSTCAGHKFECIPIDGNPYCTKALASLSDEAKKGSLHFVL